MSFQEALQDVYAKAVEARGLDRFVATAELLAPYLLHRPDHAHAWYLYGDSLRQMGLRDEAERALLRASDLAPEKIWPCIALGQLKEEFGDFEAAEQWFVRALGYPEAAERGWLWILRGANLARMNQLDQALICHRHALTQKNADLSEAHYNIGMILRAQGRYEESRDAFNRALEFSPDYPIAQEALLTLAGAAEAIALAKRLQSP